MHDLPAAHFGQALPPQSTSVSPPFLTVSSQASAAHTRTERAPSFWSMHTPLTQSEGTRHDFRSAHFEHVGPPQSMSASAWFFRRSSQVGWGAGGTGLHTPSLHS